MDLSNKILKLLKETEEDSENLFKPRRVEEREKENKILAKIKQKKFLELMKLKNELSKIYVKNFKFKVYNRKTNIFHNAISTGNIWIQEGSEEDIIILKCDYKVKKDSWNNGLAFWHNNKWWI